MLTNVYVHVSSKDLPKIQNQICEKELYCFEGTAEKQRISLFDIH